MGQIRRMTTTLAKLLLGTVMWIIAASPILFIGWIASRDQPLVLNLISISIAIITVAIIATRKRIEKKRQ